MAKRKAVRTWRHELAEFVAESQTRFSLQYVYHDGPRYIASDGKVMAVVKPAEKPAEKPVFLDVGTFPTHDAAVQEDGRYPNIDQVVPDTAKADAVLTWGPAEFDTMLALATSLAECQRHDTEFYTLLVLTIGVGAKAAVPSVRIGSQYFGRAECNAKTGPWEWGLQPHYVRNVLRLIQARKGEDITVEFHGKGESPIVFRWKAGGSDEFALIMPVDI